MRNKTLSVVSKARLFQQKHLLLTRVGCIRHSWGTGGWTGVLTSWHDWRVTASGHSHVDRWGYSTGIGACGTWLATSRCWRGWGWGWGEGDRSCWCSAGVEAAWSWLTAVLLLVCRLVHLWASLLLHWWCHLLAHWWCHLLVSHWRSSELLVHWRSSELLVHWRSSELLVHLWALGTCHVACCHGLLWLLGFRLLVLLVLLIGRAGIIAVGAWFTATAAFAGVWCRWNIEWKKG